MKGRGGRNVSTRYECGCGWSKVRREPPETCPRCGSSMNLQDDPLFAEFLMDPKPNAPAYQAVRGY
jgi:hypothetical protein